jgi:hypothetical protein
LLVAPANNHKRRSQASKITMRVGALHMIVLLLGLAFFRVASIQLGLFFFLFLTVAKQIHPRTAAVAACPTTRTDCGSNKARYLCLLRRKQRPVVGQRETVSL